MAKITEPIIKGQVGSVAISSPLTSTSLTLPLSKKPIVSPDGMQIEFRGLTLRQQFLMKLFLFESSTVAPEDVRQQAKMVRTALEPIVKDIHIDYGQGKANPGFTFELEDIKEYKTSRFTDEERQRLQAIDEQINQLASQNKMVPPSLINERNQLNEAVGSRGSVGNEDNVALIYSMYKHCVSLPVTEYALRLIELRSDDISKVYKPKVKKARVKPAVSNKPVSFRRAGHLIDQTLKYESSSITSNIGELPLSEERANTMLEMHGKSAQDVAGIQLTGSEQKFIDCLCRMLHEKSQITNPTEANYYGGDLQPQLVPYGSIKELSPTLGFTLYEFAKAYAGDDHPSGKDMQTIVDVLKTLLKKEFFISYSWQVENNKKTKRYTISELATLITLKNLSVEDLDGDVLLNQNDTWVVGLNPIFQHQIASKYVDTPYDIVARTVTACGKLRVPASTTKLRDYLLRARGTKNYNQEIGQDKLYWTLCPEWMQQGRKKRAGEYTKSAIESMVRLGLLTSWSLVAGTAGQPKFQLTISKDWK